MDSQSEGRIHYGRQDTRSTSANGESAYAPEFDDSARRSVPQWYNEPTREQSAFADRESLRNDRSMRSDYPERNYTRSARSTRPSSERNYQRSSRSMRPSSSDYERSNSDYPNRPRRNPNASVWEESSNARTRRAERQGTARDAQRIQERHKRQSRRTSNRSTVYNTGGTQEDIMFQAVAAGDLEDRQAHKRNHANYGGINSKGAWRSSSEAAYPALREHRRNNLAKFALPAIILVLAIVAVALGVHSCVSG